MVIAMSFCYRFFANLSSYIPSFSALVLFILSSHCHFAFPCVLVFSFFLFYVFILFTFFMILSSCLKCLPVLFLAVPRTSTVFLLWFEESDGDSKEARGVLAKYTALFVFNIELT